MEDTNNGNRIVAFDGKGIAKDKAEAIVSYISKITNVLSYKNDKELYSRMLKFATNMQKEVKNFNSGKKKTIKKEPIKILAPKNIVTTKKRLPSVIKLINKTIDKVYKKSIAKKSAPKKKAAKKIVRKVVKKKAAPKKVAKKKLTPRDYDKRYQAKKPGKRISTGKNYPYIEGNVYYENRANRSDRGKLLGIGKSGFSLMTDLNETLQKMHETQNRINIYTNAIKDKSISRYDKINIRQEFKNQKKYLTELKTHFRELKKML
jgi:hypothetical protein